MTCETLPLTLTQLWSLLQSREVILKMISHIVGGKPCQEGLKKLSQSDQRICSCPRLKECALPHSPSR